MRYSVQTLILSEDFDCHCVACASVLNIDANGATIVTIVRSLLEN